MLIVPDPDMVTRFPDFLILEIDKVFMQMSITDTKNIALPWANVCLAQDVSGDG